MGVELSDGGLDDLEGWSQSDAEQNGAENAALSDPLLTDDWLLTLPVRGAVKNDERRAPLKRRNEFLSRGKIFFNTLQHELTINVREGISAIKCQEDASLTASIRLGIEQQAR